MPITHYQILGIGKAATADEVRHAYRKQAMLWHPDRNPGNPAAHRRFIAIQGAYEVLSNPARRAEYDTLLVARERPRPAQPNRADPHAPSRSRRAQPQRQSPPRYNLAWLSVMLVFTALRMCNQQKDYTAVDYSKNIPLRVSNGNNDAAAFLADTQRFRVRYPPLQDSPTTVLYINRRKEAEAADNFADLGNGTRN